MRRGARNRDRGRAHGHYWRGSRSGGWIRCRAGAGTRRRGGGARSAGTRRLPACALRENRGEDPTEGLRQGRIGSGRGSQSRRQEDRCQHERERQHQAPRAIGHEPGASARRLRRSFKGDPGWRERDIQRQQAGERRGAPRDGLPGEEHRAHEAKRWARIFRLQLPSQRTRLLRLTPAAWPALPCPVAMAYAP